MCALTTLNKPKSKEMTRLLTEQAEESSYNAAAPASVERKRNIDRAYYYTI